MRQITQESATPQVGTFRKNIDGHEVVLSMLIHAPRIVMFDNVLTSSECSSLRELYAGEELERSAVISNGRAKTHQERTSRERWIAQGTHPTADLLQARISSLTACPLEKMEAVNIIQYAVSEQYRPHFDYFDDLNVLNSDMRLGGQRTGTFITYLNDVEQGGFTRFPNLGLTFTPRQGSGIYFEYKRGKDKQDGLTLHSGTPVIHGTKWIATTWIRETSRNFISGKTS